MEVILLLLGGLCVIAGAFSSEPIFSSSTEAEGIVWIVHITDIHLSRDDTSRKEALAALIRCVLLPFPPPPPPPFLRI